MKSLVWHGSSFDDLKAFPASAKQDAGFQLDKVQRGMLPDDWKPMTTIGSGVKEIRIHETAGVFRVIYVTAVEDSIHILHAFHKKDQKTRYADLVLARARFKALIAR